MRADMDKIVIGDRTNIQDGVIFHTDPNTPITVGKENVIGHGAIVHGCYYWRQQSDRDSCYDFEQSRDRQGLCDWGACFGNRRYGSARFFDGARFAW
jgi:hypothetical protein